jgi:CRISPR-associated protein NE0113 (Cas_NE0113)
MRHAATQAATTLSPLTIRFTAAVIVLYQRSPVPVLFYALIREGEMTAPHDYPKRILLAVSGLSPQVLTETLYALAVTRPRPFVPTEIHLITAREGARRARLTLLHRGDGHFHRLCRDYDLHGIAFDEERIHVLHGAQGEPWRIFEPRKTTRPPPTSSPG